GSELERILGIDVGVQGVVGFIVIFVAAMILIAVSGYVLRAVFRFAGLGAIDVLLGILFSVAKVALIVSVLFSWFDNANKNYEWASRECVAESRWYEPVKGITDKLTPYFEELADKFLD
ncbi:MAG: CvpA family protein, partial [Alistipes sp.]|nr:CvpA family protein [Alistipes sp.]